MNENEKQSSWKPIAGGIVLILVLFVAINFVFWGLEQAIPKPPVNISESTSVIQSEAPNFCMYCGKELPETFQWGQFCPWCGEMIEQ